jgi:hypothetical protein
MSTYLTRSPVNWYRRAMTHTHDDVRLPLFSGEMVKTEQMIAAASYVGTHYGIVGYRIGVEVSSFGYALFRVRHSDGSEFRLLVDRWGNVEDVAQNLPLDVALGQASQQLRLRSAG